MAPRRERFRSKAALEAQEKARQMERELAARIFLASVAGLQKREQCGTAVVVAERAPLPPPPPLPPPTVDEVKKLKAELMEARAERSKAATAEAAFNYQRLVDAREYTDEHARLKQQVAQEAKDRAAAEARAADAEAKLAAEREEARRLEEARRREEAAQAVAEQPRSCSNKRVGAIVLAAGMPAKRRASRPGLELPAPVGPYGDLGGLPVEMVEWAKPSVSLGVGGCCAVWKGSFKTYVGDTVLVAVKKVRAQEHLRGARTTFVQQLVVEVRQLRAYNHQNVISSHGIMLGSTGEPYALLEFCARGSLADCIKKHLWPAGRDGLGWRVASGLASALTYLHSREHEVIHLDVKPANMLLTDTFEVKLADFGFSSVRERDAAEPLLTRAGTSPFRAPEVWARKPVTCAADIFSFAAVLVCLVVQRPTPYEYNREVLEARVPCGMIKPTVPHEHPWAELVDKCAALRSSDRLSAHEVVEMLSA